MKPIFRSLQTKIAAGYFVLMILLIAVALWSLSIISKMSDDMNQILTQNYNSVIASENMVEALERQNSAELLMLSNQPESLGEQIERFEKDKEIFFNWFQRSSDNMSHQREKEILDTLRQQYQSYLLDHADFVKQIQVKELSLAKQFYLTWVLPKNNGMKEKCFRIFEINQGAMYESNQKTQQSANQAIVTIVALSVITLLFGLYASWKFTSFVVTPVRDLTETVMEIGRGNLNKSVQITSADEVGKLGEEFNKMTERLRHFEALNIDRIITEKKKSESIVASIADPLIVIDASKKIIHTNEAAKSLFIHNSSDVIDCDIQTVLVFDEIKNRLRSLMEPNPSQEERAEEVEIQTNGRKIFYRIRYTPIQSLDGQLIGDVILFQDITRFKEIDRLKTEFVANVSHELRTPLTSIRMVVDLLLAESIAPLNDQYRTLLQTSRSDCDRLTKMVQDMLDLSRLESGKITLHKVPMDLRRFIEDIVSTFHMLIQEKHLHIKILSAEDLPLVPIDHNQFRLVISNLFGNAIRFTDITGSITFTIDKRDSFLCVEIEDTGRGISTEHLPNVFDKFIQVSGELTPGSVGLGLSIVKEIVQLHGGEIGVTSKVGQGSTFWFTIPLTTNPEQIS